MLAALLDGYPSEMLRLAEMTDPIPQVGEILVRVKFCGICGTDLHILDGRSYKPKTPFVLGHEPVGSVVDIGDGVASDWLGSHIVPTLFIGCGECQLCTSGNERLCTTCNKVLGVSGLNGAFAEFFTVPVVNAVRVPSQLSDIAAASLVDSGATAHNGARTIDDYMAPRRGCGLVLGAGPVGYILAQLLRTAGQEIIVLDSNEDRRARVADLGIRTAMQVSAIDHDVDFVAECTGAPEIISMALRKLVPRGLLLLAGYSQVPDFDLARIAQRELCIKGVRSGDRRDLEAVLMAAESGALIPPIASVFSLRDINTAIRQLRAGQIAGKAIISINTDLEEIAWKS